MEPLLPVQTSQRRAFGPGQEGRKGRETEESTPVPFPLAFFQGHCLLDPCLHHPFTPAPVREHRTALPEPSEQNSEPPWIEALV